MDTLKELISQIKLFCRFDMAVVTKLEELESELYKSREDCKSLRTAYNSLEKRYSELLYVLRDIQNQIKSGDS